MRTGLFPVLFGALAGLGAAVLAGRALSALLYGLSPLDPMSFAAAAFTLASAAMLASYLPARRAAGTDPASALRVE
jgi:ABC-type antimicrobial peptide transport system permease subunit